MANEKALLGAGCFWGVEHIFRTIPGIVSTEVGYAGGTTKNPTYQEVCTGATDHAEVVLVEFDPSVISYEGVLDVFFRLHDPTTLNRQHNDIGTQYRSVIFTYSEEQQQKAKDYVAKVDASHVFKNPVVTQVMAAPEFFTAEAYHQDYLIKNPSGYMCHILRP
ncbi:peptide-methionine (S)-S-oxide reductase [Bacteriovorax stolpii]|uniref:Peptide methionine sulfoxide reductase MsrA n=1 Tax=Bacteriovorax stolpii TaxID=960 RepID=A0A2K9NPZ4_BACTC|nr:peptide-methionine (S)-S-oxide reductase MsrA [Bacteriovorax stolpii]AUN97581.1 peptide-methionine (S)-S-oxide reductase [Bacteriovorax stolpii]QDK42446.1 peptide-methionine (S)-S-oxide reductase [Bacteriovorax stolpii]TDP52762.1 peptide-methionine (S)-S-oxide reductase [Bacteriovorax stolpii]